MGQIVAGTAFDPDAIAKRYWEVVRSDGPWHAAFRFTGEERVASEQVVVAQELMVAVTPCSAMFAEAAAG